MVLQNYLKNPARNESVKKDLAVLLFAMKELKTIRITAVLIVMAAGLFFVSIASAELAHAQGNVTSAGKSMASYAGNKTASTANQTSAATGNVTNSTAGGNQSANPLAKIPVIGKLLGGK